MSEIAHLLGYGFGLFILTAFGGFGLFLGAWAALLVVTKLLGKW